MHDSSFRAMQKFFDILPKDKPLRVLDVGSRVCDGQELCYRDALPSELWHYTGMDVQPGRNVDCVLEDPAHWPFPDGSFDAVISGQCFEHVDDLHTPFREMGRVLKSGGLACVIAPWNWSIHRYPKDCWRILPDGMQFLLEKCAGLAHSTSCLMDVHLRNLEAPGQSLLGEYFIRKEGSQEEVRVNDFLLDGGVALGDIVIQGDCVGMGVKA